MSFHVGQKVVCVKDDGHLGRWRLKPNTDLEGLTRGHEYTIRKVGHFRGQPSVWLNEIVRKAWCVECGEYGYASVRFRPLIERKTDISVFRALLNPNKQLERA